MKFKPGDYVYVKSEAENGYVASCIGQKNGQWCYEVESAKDRKTVYIVDESDIDHVYAAPVTGNYTFTGSVYTGGSSHVNLGGVNIQPTPLDLDNMDTDGWNGYQATSNFTSGAPKCECGLHKIDPNRSEGHSGWCPLYHRSTREKA